MQSEKYFSKYFTKEIQAKINELESESKIFIKMRGKVGKSSELTPFNGP